MDSIWYEDFRVVVKNRIIKQLTSEERLRFAWLCATRALPSIVSKEGSFCWDWDVSDKHLYSVLKSLHLLSTPRSPVSDAAFAASSYAALAASSAASAYASAASAYAYAATTFAANGSAQTIVASLENADNDDASAAAYSATSLASHISRKQAEEIILQDIDLMQRYVERQKFPNYAEIFGEAWNNFFDALRSMGCEYWADEYQKIFENGFVVDQATLDLWRGVPSEIETQGAAAVATYLSNIGKQGSVYTQRETRLILLGSAGAGKTTLAKRLNGERDYLPPDASTHGVDTRITLDVNGIKTHVWDFGGQVIYHASHRCFLSENCVYILVVNARTEENRDINRINYWLDTIRLYSESKAKVFIVINESDAREQNVEDYSSFKDGEYGDLVQEIFSFNIGSDIDSVNEFKEILADYIESVGHQVFGKNDNSVMEQIKSRFEANTQILPAYELERILSENGINTREDQQRAIRLFNTLGTALSYDFLDSYVLDPYWISHGVYKVIDYLRQNKSPFIGYNDLGAVFADERGTYPEDKHEYILKLMEHHRIGFNNKDGIRGLIIPCVASQLKPRDIIVSAEPDCIVTKVARDNWMEFPADFFYKFIAANEDTIKKNGEKWAMWQTGMVLAHKRASALVELKNNSGIEITVWGEGKEEYQHRLEDLIDNLLKEYSFKSYKQEQNDPARGGKVINFISVIVDVVVKAGVKGITEVMLQRFSGGAGN